MATTEDAIVDRVRAVVTGLGFTEAPGLDFARAPAGAADKAFTVRWSGFAGRGGMDYTEEARGLVTVAIARVISDDYEASQRAVLADGRSIFNAIVRDAHADSGEYAVEDVGRGIDIDAPKGANHLIGRVRVPVNYEADLSL